MGIFVICTIIIISWIDSSKKITQMDVTCTFANKQNNCPKSFITTVCLNGRKNKKLLPIKFSEVLLLVFTSETLRWNLLSSWRSISDLKGKVFFSLHFSDHESLFSA